MAQTKVVAQSSNKVVLRERVKFSEVDSEPVAFVGFIGLVLSLFGVAMPLNVFAHLELGLSFLAAGGSVASVAGVTFLACYAKEVSSSASSHTISNFPYGKALAGTLVPFGQKIKSGKGQVRLGENKDSLKNLVYRPSGTSEVATHDIATRVKFTPLGAYIEQELTSTPSKVWDEAFNSTVSVHKFRDPKVLKKDRL
jgi:hypothetical protein